MPLDKDRATAQSISTENLVKFGRVVFEIWEQTDNQTAQRQKNAHCNYAPLPGKRNKHENVSCSRVFNKINSVEAKTAKPRTNIQTGLTV